MASPFCKALNGRNNPALLARAPRPAEPSALPQGKRTHVPVAQTASARRPRTADVERSLDRPSGLRLSQLLTQGVALSR